MAHYDATMSAAKVPCYAGGMFGEKPGLEYFGKNTHPTNGTKQVSPNLLHNQRWKERASTAPVIMILD